MIRAISASPLIDRAAFAAANAKGARIVVDPARGLVQARGFQTLYEVPRDLQTALRLDLLDLPARRIGARSTGRCGRTNELDGRGLDRGC